MAANSKSPADLKREGEELKALFAKVKKKQHNCALLMSKDGIIVEAHIKKSPDILFKAAKKNGGTPKGAWGTMTMDGQVIIIDPINDKIPGNLTKLAKKFFAARGLKFRLEILEPEEDSAPEAGAEGTSTSQTGAADEIRAEGADGGDQKQELQSRLAKMARNIGTLQADTENVMHSALQDALSAHKRAMDAEDFDRGASTLGALEGVLEDYEGLMVKKRPLMARMQAMASAAARVKSGDNSDAADQIGRAMREFDYALSNNEWIGAGEKLDMIEQLTQAHSSAETENAAQINESVSEAGNDADDHQEAKAKLAQWLEKNKPGINQLLKNKNAKHNKDLIKHVGAYQKAQNADNIAEAKQALIEVASVLKAHAAEKKKSAEKKAAIFAEMKNIEKKLSKLVPHISIK